MAKPSLVDLVGVGLNATDTLIPLATFPERGSKIQFTQASIQPGGQAATTVLACQLWGLATRYVGKLGDDHAAQLHLREFARAGVDARIVTVPHTTSAQSVILVDEGGERTVLNQRNPRVQLTPADLDRDWIVNARALHVDGLETAAATLAASWARQAGIPTIADLDELYPGVEDLIANIDYLIVSRDFPTALTGEHNLEHALRTLMHRFGCTVTAATLGHEGVLAWDGSRFHLRPAYQVHVADTTGAGDIFHAGFIYGLLQGWPLPRSLDFACAAAALNCTAQGARGHIAPVAEIESLMATAPRYATAPALD